MLITNVGSLASVSEVGPRNMHLKHAPQRTPYRWSWNLVTIPTIDYLGSFPRPYTISATYFPIIRLYTPGVRESDKQRVSKSLEQIQNKQMWILKVTFRHHEMESPYMSVCNVVVSNELIQIFKASPGSR